jgi:hypothetical protein
LCGHATGYQHTWSEIADHSCGRYKEEADKRIDKAQRSNKRYQHYCLRWWVHPAPVTSHSWRRKPRELMQQWSLAPKQAVLLDAAALDSRYIPLHAVI